MNKGQVVNAKKLLVKSVRCCIICAEEIDEDDFCIVCEIKVTNREDIIISKRCSDCNCEVMKITKGSKCPECGKTSV